jgi:hypothetical protein
VSNIKAILAKFAEFSDESEEEKEHILVKETKTAEARRQTFVPVLPKAKLSG